MVKTNMVKLDNEKVRLVKTLLATGVIKHSEIAEIVGVSRPTITKINLGLRYADVDIDEGIKLKKLIFLEYETTTGQRVRELLKQA